MNVHKKASLREGGGAAVAVTEGALGCTAVHPPPLCKGRWPGVSRVGGIDGSRVTGQPLSQPYG